MKKVQYVVAALALLGAGSWWYANRNPEFAHKLGCSLVKSGEEAEVAENDNYRCEVTWKREDDTSIEYHVVCDVKKKALLHEASVSTRIERKRKDKKNRPEWDKWELVDRDKLVTENIELDAGSKWEKTGTLDAKKSLRDVQLIVEGRFSWPGEELEDLGKEIDRQKADEHSHPYKYKLWLRKVVY